jgi:peptide/nickel transport system permease protein
MATGLQLAEAPETLAGASWRDSRASFLTVWTLRRLGFGVVTLFLVSIVVFLATHLLPGNAARAILGVTATPARVAVLEQQLGLNKPTWEQYTSWVGGLFRGDLGMSLAAREPVSTVIGWRVLDSLQLLLAAAVVSIPVSVGLGILAAVRPGKAADHAINGVSVVLAALPEFVTGLLLVLLFAVGALHLLPAVSLAQPGDTPLSNPRILALPVLTLTLAVIPYLSRLVRASLIEALNSDYVIMARLKGLKTPAIVIRHALRNALIPAVQGTALTLAYLLGGVVIVEYVFQYPGLGSALQEAVNQRDIPVLQAIVMFFAAAFVLFNIAADILTMLLTPRLRTR